VAHVQRRDAGVFEGEGRRSAFEPFLPLGVPASMGRGVPTPAKNDEAEK
jgi:hypothetical protein